MDVVETSRGCTFDCSFCSIIEMRGRNFHRFAIETVIAEDADAAWRLANKLGGQYFYMHAPLFVDSQSTRDTLLEQATIRHTIERARTAQVALVGIGTTDPEASSFLRAGHLTPPQLAELRAQPQKSSLGKPICSVP